MQEALKDTGCIGLDTNPIIYFVQQTQLFFPIVADVFDRISRGKLRAITSSLSLMETLVLPLRATDVALQQTFKKLLLHSEGVQTVAISDAVALRAAEMRARYKLKPADALQIAAAIEGGCDAFLTNDDHFNSVTETRILVVRELEP